jgi:hypothetical protein
MILSGYYWRPDNAHKPEKKSVWRCSQLKTLWLQLRVDRLFAYALAIALSVHMLMSVGASDWWRCICSGSVYSRIMSYKEAHMRLLARSLCPIIHSAANAMFVFTENCLAWFAISSGDSYKLECTILQSVAKTILQTSGEKPSRSQAIRCIWRGIESNDRCTSQKLTRVVIFK